MNLSRLRKLILLVLVPLVFGASQSAEGGFKEGWDAYDRNDYATALKEWKTLAEQGNATAQYSLAVMYDKGQGVPQDYKTAVKWYTLAAKQGKVSAQYNLGLMYAKGQGVPQGYIYAHMWFDIAASSGNKDALKNRDIVAKRMTPSQLVKAQDLDRECVRKKYERC